MFGSGVVIVFFVWIAVLLIYGKINLPECTFYKQTGFYCAGCGGTRAFFLLLQGRFLESLRFNSLCSVIFGAFFYIVLEQILRKTRFAVPPLRITPRIGVVAVGILVLYMVLRNIPVYPWVLLAPTLLD